MQSDHWYSEVFRALPDLVCRLLPGLEAAEPGDTDTDTDTDTETAYSFRPITLKKVTHHPDGVLWPRQHPGGSEQRPVVILEVQMHADRRFLVQDVTWVDLAALASKPDLDPSIALLTLPVQKEQDLGPCTKRILAEGRQEGVEQGVEEGRRLESSALNLRLLERRGTAGLAGGAVPPLTPHIQQRTSIGLERRIRAEQPERFGDGWHHQQAV